MQQNSDNTHHQYKRPVCGQPILLCLDWMHPRCGTSPHPDVACPPVAAIDPGMYADAAVTAPSRWPPSTPPLPGLSAPSNLGLRTFTRCCDLASLDAPYPGFDLDGYVVSSPSASLQSPIKSASTSCSRKLMRLRFVVVVFPDGCIQATNDAIDVQSEARLPNVYVYKWLIADVSHVAYGTYLA